MMMIERPSYRRDHFRLRAPEWSAVYGTVYSGEERTSERRAVDASGREEQRGASLSPLFGRRRPNHNTVASELGAVAAVVARTLRSPPAVLRRHWSCLRLLGNGNPLTSALFFPNGRVDSTAFTDQLRVVDLPPWAALRCTTPEVNTPLASQ